MTTTTVDVPAHNRHLLIVTRDGYAKRIDIASIRKTDRCAQGITVSPSPIAATLVVDDDDEVMVASRLGIVERVAVRTIPRRKTNQGRGVRRIRLAWGDRVAEVAKTCAETPGGLHSEPLGARRPPVKGIGPRGSTRPT